MVPMEKRTGRDPNFVPSLVRTVVPVIVGAVVSGLAAIGLDVQGDVLTPAITAVVSAAYYAGVRLLERRFWRAGHLLGTPGAPEYSTPVVD